jgi:predicted secreted protein
MIGYLNMQNRFLLLLLFYLVISPACSAQDLALRKGASQIISLEENPSTGYQWIIHPPSAFTRNIIIIHDLGFKKNNTMPGSPGIHKWRLSAQKSGRSVLQFFYKRSWESEVVKEITINIIVN